MKILKKTYIIKDVRKIFRLKKLKKTNDAAIKDIRNLFRLEKGNKAIKHRILRDIQNLFEHEEKDYYKPVIGNFCSNNYVKYKSKGDRKTLSVEKYLSRIRP